MAHPPDKEPKIQTSETGLAPSGEASPDEDDINILDALIVLAKHKWLVLGLPLVAGAAAALISLQMPNIYTATARILPPQQSQSSAAAMLAQFGGSAGIAGSALGIRNANDVYVAMLKSRTLADNLIERFDLKTRYEVKKMVDAQGKLGGASNIASGRDGVISISVDDEDPKQAAALANAYIEELEKLSLSLAITEASQRRLFFEKQLKDAREQLVRAEVSLNETIETKGMTGVEVRSKSLVEMVAQLRAQITARQVQIDAMRIFATEDHPDAKRLRQEISSLKMELAKLEGGNPRRNEPKSETPAGMESLRLLRDIKYLEAVADLLSKQFEAAKMDEAKDALLIQVLDRAVEPERKSKPNRTNIVLLVSVAAGVLGILLAFLSEAVARAMVDPARSHRIHLLWTYLRRQP